MQQPLIPPENERGTTTTEAGATDGRPASGPDEQGYQDRAFLREACNDRTPGWPRGREADLAAVAAEVTHAAATQASTKKPNRVGTRTPHGAHPGEDSSSTSATDYGSLGTREAPKSPKRITIDSLDGGEYGAERAPATIPP